MLRQMSFKSAMKHKVLVAEVACDARSAGKLPILGVLYDEVSRHRGVFSNAFQFSA